MIPRPCALTPHSWIPQILPNPPYVAETRCNEPGDDLGNVQIVQSDVDRSRSSWSWTEKGQQKDGRANEHFSNPRTNFVLRRLPHTQRPAQASAARDNNHNKESRLQSIALFAVVPANSARDWPSVSASLLHPPALLTTPPVDSLRALNGGGPGEQPLVSLACYTVSRQKTATPNPKRQEKLPRMNRMYPPISSCSS